MKKTLLLGTTPDRNNKKWVKFDLSPTSYFDGEVYTLDILDSRLKDPRHIVFDLEQLHAGIALPYQDGEFDEIHAYEILEHYGMQGDFRGFFREFAEFWRVLKPGGLMMISCPMWDSPWSFGDPGHRRVLPAQCFSFLVKRHYDQLEEDANSSCTDYRSFIGDCWFDLLGLQETTDKLFVILQKA